MGIDYIVTRLEWRQQCRHSGRANADNQGVTPMDERQAIGTRDLSIQFLQALGYRVTKPKPKARPLLNAIGKPFGPNYDPNYKIKMPKTSIKRLYGPMTNFPWVSDGAQTELTA